MISIILVLCFVFAVYYFMIYGIVYLFCLVLGLMFSSKLVVAVWGVSLFIMVVARKKHGCRQMDGQEDREA